MKTMRNSCLTCFWKATPHKSRFIWFQISNRSVSFPFINNVITDSSILKYDARIFMIRKNKSLGDFTLLR